jgi:hypothetical protein
VVRRSRVLLIAVCALAIGACHKQQQNDQNIIVDNGVMANAEIETLPADESSGTPSDELANGADNPDVNDLNASTNAD